MPVFSPMQTKTISESLLIAILTLGVFGIINTEMGVVGIIPQIAERFDVTVWTSGLCVSVFALAGYEVQTACLTLDDLRSPIP